jgi:hypothetical protein
MKRQEKDIRHACPVSEDSFIACGKSITKRFPNLITGLARAHANLRRCRHMNRPRTPTSARNIGSNMPAASAAALPHDGDKLVKYKSVGRTVAMRADNNLNGENLSP